MQLSQAEDQAAAAGAESFTPTRGIVSGILDVIRRPAYAVSAMVDSYAKGEPAGAMDVAAARELMSGIGGIQGQKVGFSERAEQLGVPEMGRLSTAVRASPLKWMYSETGEGIPFQIGGPLDPTGRGVLFSLAEAPLDPSTYVSFGAGSFGEIPIRGAGQALKYLSRPGKKFLGAEIERLAPKTIEGMIDVARATPEGQAVTRRAVEAFARSKAIDSEVAGLADDLLARPIPSPGSPAPAAEATRTIINDVERMRRDPELYRAVADAARTEAENRTIAAAALNPKLLDKGGMKWMGWTIPYSPAIAAGVSGTTVGVAARLAQTVHGAFGLDVAKGTRKVVDALGGLWERDWFIRNLPGVKAAKVQRFDDAAVRAAQLAKSFSDSDLPGMFKTDAEWEKFVDAWEAGNLAGYSEKIQAAAAKVGGLSDDMRTGEIVRGLVPEHAAAAREAAVGEVAPAYKAMVTDIAERRTALVAERKDAGRTFADAANSTGVRVRALQRSLAAEDRASLSAIAKEAAAKRRAILEGGEAGAEAEVAHFQSEIARVRKERAAIEAEAPRGSVRSIVAKDREIPGLRRAGFQAGQPVGGRPVMTSGGPASQAALESFAKRLTEKDTEIALLEKYLASAGTGARQATEQALSDLESALSLTSSLIRGGGPARIEQAARDATRQGIRSAQGVYQSRVAKVETALMDLAHEEQLTKRLALAQGQTYIHEQTMRGAARSGAENYWPRYYDNTPQELDVIFDGAPGYIPSTSRDTSNLGRYNESRVFRTQAEARAWHASEKLNRPFIPDLKPVVKPDAWLRRISDHAEKTAVHDYYATVGKMVGVTPEQWASDAVGALDLTRPAYRGMLTAAQSRELMDITAAVQKGKTSLAFLRSLSAEGRAEFMRQRIGRVGSVGELTATMEKYREFLRDVPRRGPMPNEIAPDGTPFVRAPGAVRELDGLRIPQSLANDIQGADSRMINSPALRSAIKAVGTFNDIMRTGVYSVFAIPANWRNKVSNVATGISAAGFRYLDPRLQSRMLKLLGGMDGRVVTQLGETYSYEQVRHDLLTMGLHRTGREKVEQTALESVANIATRGPRWSHWLAAKTENGDLAALYLSQLENGASREQAAAFTKQWMIDYGDLSAFDREILRTFFLFPTYPKRTIVNQARFILHNPGRASALYAKMFSGRESENRDMTTWEADAFKIRLDRNGRDLTVLTGVDLPIRQMDILWRGSLGKTAAGVAGMLTPLPLKSLMEVVTGVNTFTRKPFGRKTIYAIGKLLDKSPAWLQNVVGFTNNPDAAGRPVYTVNEERYHMVLESWALSRFVSTTDRQFREYLKDENYLSMFFDLTTGHRIKTLNLDAERKKMVAEKTRLVNEAMAARGEKKAITIYTDGGGSR